MTNYTTLKGATDVAIPSMDLSVQLWAFGMIRAGFPKVEIVSAERNATIILPVYSVALQSKSVSPFCAGVEKA